MGNRRRYVFVTVATESGVMPAAALESVQQYAYRLADAMHIKPNHIRAEAADNKSITFTFADSIEYEDAPLTAVKNP